MHLGKHHNYDDLHNFFGLVFYNAAFVSTKTIRLSMANDFFLDDRFISWCGFVVTNHHLVLIGILCSHML